MCPLKEKNAHKHMDELNAVQFSLCDTFDIDRIARSPFFLLSKQDLKDKLHRPFCDSVFNKNNNVYNILYMLLNSFFNRPSDYIRYYNAFRAEADFIDKIN